jgi:hypothetical protein
LHSPRRLTARRQQLEVGAVVERAAPIGELREALADAVSDVVTCPEDEIDLGQSPAYGAARKLGQPVTVHLEDESRSGYEAPGEREKLAHVLEMDDVWVEFRKAPQACRCIAVCVEANSLKFPVGQVEAAQAADKLAVGGMASRVGTRFDEEVSHSFARTLREAGMAKRADGHFESTVGNCGEVASEVVHDAGDRTAGNGWRDRQVLLREKPDANALF